MPDLIRTLRPLVSRSASLSRLYRSVRDDLAARRPPAMTPLGFKFGGNPQMASGRFEPDETRLVRALLPRVTVVINVGANIGYYCCIALQAGKTVVAFEPVAANQRALYRNVTANGWADRFECHPIALSDRTGLMDIFGSGTGASLIAGWSGQTYSTTVPVSTLDRALGDRFASEARLIIVDVEGVELAVRKGAERCLRGAVRPIWLVEIDMASHRPAGEAVNPAFVETFERFEAFGYVALAATADPRPVPVDEVRAAVRAGAGAGILGAHNFLFVEASRVEEILAACRRPGAETGALRDGEARI